MVSVATICTGNEAFKDLLLMIKSIELFEPSKPTIYIATDDVTKPLIDSVKYRGILKIFSIMNEFSGLPERPVKRPIIAVINMTMIASMELELFY